MPAQSPELGPEIIEELCRRYREAERAQAQHFERCEVRFSPTALQPLEAISHTEHYECTLPSSSSI